MNNFTHWNEEGRPKMVDISAKEVTTRIAIARSTITLSDTVYEAIQQGGIKKVIRHKLLKLQGLWVQKNGRYHSYVPSHHASRHRFPI